MHFVVIELQFCPFDWEIPIVANFSRELNYTNLGENLGQSSARQEIVLYFRYVTRFEARATQRQSESKIRAKFGIFHPHVKLGEGWVKYLSEFFVLQLRPSF